MKNRLLVDFVRPRSPVSAFLRQLGFVAACVAAAPVAAQAPTSFKEPASGIELVRIPGGCFGMGVDAPGERIDGFPIPVPRQDEVPRHEVCVDGFWIGRSEVTRAQWQRIMQPSGGPLKDPERPVADVSWQQARAFTERLSALGAGRFRLPTEAEWEYACHAGQPKAPVQPTGEARQPFIDALARDAWFGPGRRNPHAMPAAQKAPNAWGLHDMLGNVWEWNEDGYDEQAYTKHVRSNPKSGATGERRVLRGGSYKSELSLVRCGVRNYGLAGDRSPVIGLRVVMVDEGPANLKRGDK